MGLMLTLRAKNCTPASHFGLFQKASASLALLPAAPVHGKGILKGPHIAVGIPVITNGTAALGDGQ